MCVCVYLSSNYNKNQVIIIKDYTLTVKPLNNRNKRVVISNVHPVIPNDVIVNTLKRHGINIVSHITELRASLVKPGKAHILSFRRQFYIKDEDVNKLPNTLQLSHDETSYWTFLSTDSTACFLCKKTGHIAKMCPLATTEVINNSQQYNSVDPTQRALSSLDQLPVDSSQNAVITIHNNTLENSITVSHDNNLELKNINNVNDKHNKRPLSITTSETSNSNVNDLNENKHANDTDKVNTPLNFNISTPDTSTEFKTPKLNKKKKRKIEIFTETDDKCTISLSTFSNFVKASYIKCNIFDEAQKIAKDKNETVELIPKIYPHIANKKLKSRLTMLKNKLISSQGNNSTEATNSETESEMDTENTDNDC